MMISWLNFHRIILNDTTESTVTKLITSRIESQKDNYSQLLTISIINSNYRHQNVPDRCCRQVYVSKLFQFCNLRTFHLSIAYIIYLGFQPWEIDFDHTSFIRCRKTCVVRIGLQRLEP